MEIILLLALLAVLYQIYIRIISPHLQKDSSDQERFDLAGENNSSEVNEDDHSFSGRKKGKVFSGGSGSAEDPFLVASASELDRIRFYPDSCFRQIASIDLKKYSRQKEWKPIGGEGTEFNGEFDGVEYHISNLFLEMERGMYCGLFGNLGKQGILKNISLHHTLISGDTFVGSLVGWSSGKVRKSYSSGEVSGFKNVGVLVGSNRGTIEQCFAGGEVYGSRNCGGLAGWSGGKIKNSHASSEAAGNKDIGGLAGSNYGLIACCHSVGDVHGEKRAGTLVGWNIGEIKDSFARRGAAPYRQFEAKQNILKSPRQMKRKKTFSGWDFENIWEIREGESYPYLKF